MRFIRSKKYVHCASNVCLVIIVWHACHACFSDPRSSDEPKGGYNWADSLLKVSVLKTNTRTKEVAIQRGESEKKKTAIVNNINIVELFDWISRHSELRNPNDIVPDKTAISWILTDKQVSRFKRVPGEAWSKVKVGMDSSHVTSLIGMPIQVFTNEVGDEVLWRYFLLSKGSKSPHNCPFAELRLRTNMISQSFNLDSKWDSLAFELLSQERLFY